MTFDQLEYFIAVVEENTFLDAAESLHITQSALSKQIMNLEKELGVKLLDRSKRSASLTDAGTEFYKDARFLRCHYRCMLGKMQGYRSVLDHEIRIGALPILMQNQFPSRIKAFSEAHPDIVVQLDEAEEKDLLEGLDSQKYHFIIARRYLVEGDEYECHHIAEDELVAIFSAAHPIAKQHSTTAPVSLHDLANQRFLLMHPYTSVYQQCMEQLKKHNICADVIRTARVESILSAVSIGEGISLIPKSNLAVFHHENIAWAPLTPPVSLPIVLARKKHMPLSPALKTFIMCTSKSH